MRVIGVQAENAAPYVASLAAGRARAASPSCRRSPTASPSYRPGELNFEIIRDAVDEVVTVSEDDIARALLVLLERAKLVVEPAGAVSVAAIMAGLVAVRRTDVAVLSGGNIDPLLMQRVIAHGLAASERYLKLSIALPDRPGQLARIAELLAEANANVIEVLHTRHGSGLQISEVELELSIETRGPEHRARGRRRAASRRLRARSRRRRMTGASRAPRSTPVAPRAPVGYWPAQVSTPVTSTAISRPLGAV